MSTAAEPPRLSVTRPGEARLHRARALACDTVWVRSSPFISDAFALAHTPTFPRLSLSFSLILTCSRVLLLTRLLVCPHSSSHPPPPPLSLLSRSQARSFAVSTHLSLSEMTFSLGLPPRHSPTPQKSRRKKATWKSSGPADALRPLMTRPWRSASTLPSRRKGCAAEQTLCA